jgi:hypothetical protein
MNPTNYDRLIRARLAKAGMKPTFAFHSRLSSELCNRLRIGEELFKMTDREVFDLCHERLPVEGTK